ncbi:MAG: phosphopentomutase [Candidatus Zixiibacteriota bacterium]
MSEISRVIVIILDACGIGELPDASEYGDAGSATLQNTASAVGGLSLPMLESLGLGNIEMIEGVKATPNSNAAFGKMAEKSAGKDSTSGHWEHFGVILKDPFPTYPDGFPDKLINYFSELCGYNVIGNKAASGTEIIERLGKTHLDTHALIVYTSADSVFQIAAHESIVSPDELDRICDIARKLLTGEHHVGRVIARPFSGRPGNFVRTSRRKDFSALPSSPFVNQKLIEENIPVIAIGKIYDLMAGLGISKKIIASGNDECMDKMIDALDSYSIGLIMTNLGDFDMLWGHRNDYKSFANGLEEFDLWLDNLIGKLKEDDLLIITADHGCDPTTPSTDHSREYVPLLAFRPGMLKGINLGIRESFADTGKTIADIFKIDYPFPGKSFLKEIQ